MGPKPGNGSLCKICNDASDGFHFGTLACRACAAFFRRSTVAKRHYVCRYNDKCKVEKVARCMCRACRLKKCLALGMNPEHVQDQRGRMRNGQQVADGNNSKSEEQKISNLSELESSQQVISVKAKPSTLFSATEIATTSTASASSMPVAATTTSTIKTDTATEVEDPATVPQYDLDKNKTVLTEIKSSPNAVPVIKTFRRHDEAPVIQINEEDPKYFPNNVPMLKKIYSDYRQYKKFRKIATEVVNYYDYSNDKKVLRELSVDEAKRLIRADVSVISVFVNECVPGFKILPEAEKIALFKTFLKTFLFIDGSFWTAKYFSSPKDDRCAIPFSGYIKLDVLIDLYVGFNGADNDEEIKSLKTLFGKYKRLLRDSIIELNVNEAELIGLMSVALWDTGVESLSHLTRLRVQDIRNASLKELYNYCASVDCKNAPARYGTLLEYLKIVEILIRESEKKGAILKILDVATGLDKNNE